ncbi:pyridine nucleotide-disulfide oxidoreductase [Flaviflexus salsibiostraticola]|uniref:Pyridine nucleotide-disulfide oxidoreductase n=1 Tax=Flaviflexus salsibiostraticola TaxID=1282737 RepID=A0A3S8Z9J0_9ACTO|nr:FAD-dependent oxidoreductase [Flaviflexus salsibiostraticola]AZN30189.1 pyridine nucleotide-disulfide oxidoreductase [Flaviflexus salsibiostraticola]
MEFDVAVIGWGKGGKTIAGALARAGKSVAMIERSTDMYGGACINVACIPTKALIHSAEIRPEKSFDPDYFDQSVERRDSLTEAMRGKNYSMLADLETVTIINGTARFTGPHSLLVEAGDEALEVTAETIIIDTGSIPRLPEVAGAELGGRFHTSVTLQHAPLPEHLIIVGGGYIGIEFASMFAQYGSEVTVLDKNPRPLHREDWDVAAEVFDSLADSGVRLVSGATVLRLCQETDCAAVQYLWNDQEQTVRGDAVLIALGRRPNTDGLDLAAAGIETTETGAIKVDERLATSVPGVYAVGDVNGGPQFTYISLDDSRIVLDQLTGSGTRTTADRVAVPSTIFTTPPFSKVGMTVEEARAAGHTVKIAVKKVSDIAAMPRPKIVGDPRGIIKIVVDEATDLILGAALVHVDSQEVINLVALAMRHGVTASELRDTIYIHPSSTEALNEVLASI